MSEKLAIYLILINIYHSNCFVPLTLINNVLNKIDVNFKANLGLVNPTLSHEDILRRGIIRSAARYFYDQPNGTSKINLTKLNDYDDVYYYNMKNVYHDYFGQWYCRIKLDNLLETQFEPNVASVDLNSKTRRVAYVHFDAEFFNESNQRVINFTNQIIDTLKMKSYERARVLATRILHTIQDFYSHSNWVELGNLDSINTKIGTLEFNNLNVSSPKTNQTCSSNCKLIQLECSTYVTTFISLLNLIGYDTVQCPIKYFNCSDNIVEKNRLITGYAGEDTLEDGTSVIKPNMKCSHGGIMDTSTFKEAQGGINKDSGFYILSPHAHLHSIAARLAIQHTEYFFNQIRAKIGDKEFSNFLQLEPNNTISNLSKRAYCSSNTINLNNVSLFSLFIMIFVSIYFQPFFI